jgi:hypothetical protein
MSLIDSETAKLSQSKKGGETMKYEVTFYQSFTFEVEAADEDDAFNKALPEFEFEMRLPVARTDYDDYEVEPINEDED